MSRLDSFIRRLQAQRACLDYLAERVETRESVVLELGLGNGRTYDHLRSLMPRRDIYVFELVVQAHPDCIPDDDHLVLGDIFETLPGFVSRHGGEIALVHADVGTGDQDYNRSIAGLLAEHLPSGLARGGLIACDQPLESESLAARPLPDGVPEGRYFIYARAG